LTIGESVLESVTAARTAAALQHTRENSYKANLSVGSVAKALGVSPRYLQKLLERSETSFTSEINTARLDHAYQLLGDGAARKISDIALQCGFSDISHFNRQFRARFGETPRVVQAGTIGR
jgi:AraC-like DNA-binding protein